MLPIHKKSEAHPGRSSHRETELVHVLKHTLRAPVDRTGRAPSQSQRVAEELPHLRLLAASRERDRQLGRRDQRVLVFCAEHVRDLDENLALNLHSLGMLSLL